MLTKKNFGVCQLFQEYWWRKFLSWESGTKYSAFKEIFCPRSSVKILVLVKIFQNGKDIEGGPKISSRLF